MPIKRVRRIGPRAPLLKATNFTNRDSLLSSIIRLIAHVPGRRDTPVIESPIYLHVSSYYIFDSRIIDSIGPNFLYPLTSKTARSIVIRESTSDGMRVSPPIPLFASRNRPCFGRKFMGRKQGRPGSIMARPVQNFNGIGFVSRSLPDLSQELFVVSARRGR